MKKRIIALLVMTMLMAGCKETEEGCKILPAPTEEVSESMKEKHLQKDMKTLSKSVNQFSYELYDGLEKEGNICISPYSIISALSMLDNGADGNTKTEIEKALGIEDITTQNQALHYYATMQKQKGITFYWANSIWISEEVELGDNSEEEFFQPLKQFYNADKHFQQLDTVETMNQVNKWVSKETKGMLDNLIMEPLTPETKVLLLNALYFQGEWSTAFINEGEKMQFNGTKEESMVPQMQLEDIALKYIKKDGLRGVELPYEDETFVMDIFLPEQNEENAISVFQEMNQKEKKNLFSEFNKVEKQQMQKVIMPRFTMEYDVDSTQLIGVLKELGIKDAFLSEKADFSKISTNFSLYIDEILHKTKIEVQEKGTKAAAVTSIMMSNGVKEVMEEDLFFIVNQPFLYTIRDTSTDMILFIGSVENL